MIKFQVVLLILCFGFVRSSFSQTAVPRMQKTRIGHSSCMAYLPSKDTTCVMEEQSSPDGSKVYSMDVRYGGYSFSVIAVELKDLTLNQWEEKDQLLSSYLDYLKEEFQIRKAVGYGKGHRMEDDAQAAGMIDFWEDENGEQWAVKGWAGKNQLGILMLHGKKEYPYLSVQNMFLNGFRFGN